jgi:hypothetical protein
MSTALEIVTERLRHFYDEEAVPLYDSLGQLLEQLQAAEMAAEEKRRVLEGLWRVNGLGDTDLTNYNRTRKALYNAQVEMRKLVVEALTALGPAGLVVRSQVPQPVMMPSLGQGPRVGPAGLGNVAAIPAAGWAAIVAAGIWTLVAFATAATAAAIAAVGIAYFYSRSHRATIDARWRAYESCIAGGGSALECGIAARGIASDPELPEVPSLFSGFWLVFGLAAFGLGGYALYKYSNRGTRAAPARLPASSRGASSKKKKKKKKKRWWQL